MILSIEKIARRPSEQMPFSALLNQEVLGDVFPNVRLDSAILLEGIAKNIDDGLIELKGHITLNALTPCDRCLEETSTKLNIDFDERFARAANEDEDIYPYAQDQLDLSKMIQDNLLLHWPSRVLCSQDCQGLCPVCGQNRNEISCDCLVQEEEESHPLSALKALLNEDEEV